MSAYDDLAQTTRCLSIKGEFAQIAFSPL